MATPKFTKHRLFLWIGEIACFIAGTWMLTLQLPHYGLRTAKPVLAVLSFIGLVAFKELCLWLHERFHATFRLRARS